MHRPLAVKTADRIDAVGLTPPIRQHDLPKMQNLFEMNVIQNSREQKDVFL